jgi:virulence-associated protein VapD
MSANSKETIVSDPVPDVQLTITDVQNNLEQLKFQLEQNKYPYTCFRSRTTKKNILKLFSELKGLELYQYDIFSIRYIPLYKEYQRRCTFYAIMFHLMRSVVTVGSITVPALLSLQTSSTSTGTNWLVWAISLAVTISNGILTLFKVDKKYYFIHTTKSLLESEGWQYIALTGKYSHLNDDTAKQNNHANQFPQFSLAVEKIKMRQVEEEYYKSQETSGSTVASSTRPNQGPSLNDMREMFHSVLIQTGYSPSPTGAASSEMKAWMETVLDKTNKIIVPKSTN